MMRSLFSAVSGLRNHQTRMDVIGNNIANVNTVGFKRDRVNFQDIFYQMLQPPSAATTARGSTVGQYVGVGMGIGSIDTFHTQGGVMYSGNPLDVMIQGDGYFILGEKGTGGPPTPTTNEHYTRAGVFGISAKLDGSTWHAYLVNKSNGMYVGAYTWDGSTLGTTLAAVDLGDPAGIAGISIDANGVVSIVDAGTGKIVPKAKIALAKFRNPEGLGKVGENLFAKTTISGDAIEHATGSKGSVPGQNSLGTLVPGSLEMSNVELAQEFTDMITTQRGFQANARTITVSDEMLQELVNLKR